MRNEPANLEGVQRALERSDRLARRTERRQNEWEATQVREGGYIRCTFSLAGEGMFYGYYVPTESWNGFACPFFPLSEVERIAILVDRMNSTDELCSVIVRGDVVVIREEPFEGEIVEQQVATITVDGQTLYGVGACAWCWEVR